MSKKPLFTLKPQHLNVAMVNREDARALRTFEDALKIWTVEHAKQSPERSNTTTEVEI